MDNVTESSDIGILDLLRKAGPMGVREIARATRVTATAVRQRLSRLMAQGLVHRDLERAGRGRPSHRYQLTEKGRRQTGANFADLAVALWNEVRAIEDVEVRRGLLQRIARKMSDAYSDRIRGATTAKRMESIAEVFAERNVPFEVEGSDDLPVLTAVACPYPELAEMDRGVCAMERMMLAELVGESLRLDECRLDGDTCCRFVTN